MKKEYEKSMRWFSDPSYQILLLLDEDTFDKLVKITQDSGDSRLSVIRKLIQEAYDKAKK